MNRQTVLKAIAWAIVVALIGWAVSCALNPVTGKRELMLMSSADELAMGQQTNPQILQTYGKYEDADLARYVSALGKRLGALSHQPNLAYNIQVLDSPVVNAFAVPGGYVYLTRGILAYLNDEAELAGVVAHEIGHIAARHSAQQYSKAQFAQLGLGLGSVLSKTFRKYAGVAQAGVELLFLSFSRSDEREADSLGVEYSAKAGYDSNHMANLFTSLERLNPGEAQGGLPGWFSTHPNPENRIAAIKQDTLAWREKIGQTQFAVNRDQYLKQIDGIVFGEDPRQGYVEGNVFYHPELRFQFPVPAGWKVNNTASQVQMINQDQNAVILFSQAPEKTAAAAAQAFVNESKAAVLKSESDQSQRDDRSSHRLRHHDGTRRRPRHVLLHPEGTGRLRFSRIHGTVPVQQLCLRLRADHGPVQQPDGLPQDQRQGRPVGPEKNHDPGGACARPSRNSASRRTRGMPWRS